MTQPSPIEYAKPDLGFVRRREIRVGVWSLAVAVATLLIAGPVTFFLADGAWSEHRELHPTARMIAKEKAQEAKIRAQNLASFTKQRAQLVARLTAEAAMPPFGPLDDDACERVLAVISTQANHLLTSEQKDTITQELKKPDQNWVDPKLPITADKPSRSSTLPLQMFHCDPSVGSVQIRTEQFYSAQLRHATSVRIANDGSISRRSPPPPTSQETLRRFDELQNRPAVMGDADASPPFQPQREFENALQMFLALLGLAQIGLAVLLIAAAVHVLRSDGRWRPRHRRFAIGQLILAIIGVLIWLLLYAFSEQDDYHIEAVITAIAVGLCVVATIYPIVLLRLLKQPTVLDQFPVYLPS